MSCITQEKLQEEVRRLTHARLGALVEVLSPAPLHDPGNLAAGWFKEEIYRDDGSHYHGGSRHALETAATMQMAGDTLTINLYYTIKDA